MTSTRWRLFRLLGIPIGIDPSWLVVLALLTWTTAARFAAALPDLPAAAHWGMGLGAAVAFFACLVLHELGHAVVARATGTPIRGITLFLFGGVAEIEDEPRSARDEFAMSVAGPSVSAALAAGFWLLSGLALPRPVAVVLEDLAAINLAVLVFNLVPAFPLDGGRVLRSVIWGATGDLRRATHWAGLCGLGFSWLLIAAALLNFFAGNVLQGIWLGLIGLFLGAAARGGYEQVLLRQVLAGVPVSRFMTAAPVVVSPNLNLREWVEEFVYRHHCTSFPVVSGERLEGVIDTESLSRYPLEEWADHTVGEVMRPEVGKLIIGPETVALDALRRMRQTGASRLLVVDGERLLGVVGVEDLLGFLSLKLELEGAAVERNPSAR